MNRLDRYLLKETAIPFVFALGFVTLLVLLFQAQRLVGAAIGFGLGALDLAIIFLTALPPFLVTVVPLAYLLSVLIGIGRLAADRELVALGAAGAAPWRIARVPLVLGLVVSAICLPLAHFAEPHGMRVLYGRLVEVALRNVSRALRPGLFNEDFTGLALYAGGSGSDGALSEVLLFDERDRQRPMVMTAAAGALTPRADRALSFELVGGEIHLGTGGDPHSYQRLGFDRLELGIDAGREVGARTKFVSGLTRMTSAEMIDEWRRYGPDDAYGRKVEKLFWRRFSLPMMAAIFGLVGAAIALTGGAAARARSAVLGLGAVVGYYVLLRLGDLLVVSLPGTAVAGAFGPNLIVLAAALFGLARAGRPR